MSAAGGLLGRLCWLGLLAGAVLSVGNARRGLLEPSEGRYGSIAAEMERSGDLIVPRFNDRPHLEKPPMSMWAMAGSLALFGENEAALRLPGVAACSIAVVVAFLLAAGSRGAGELAERRARGSLAALLALSTPLLFFTARVATTDALLAGFIALSLLFAVRSLDEDRGAAGRRRQLTLALVFSALGFLTKGPVVWLFTLLPLTLEALWSRRPRELRAIFHPARLLLFLAVVLPWFLALESRAPGSLTWLLEERAVGAAASSKSFHAGPPYYFVPVFLLGIFPAGPLLLAAGRRGLGRILADRGRRLLFLAVLPPFVIFSLSASKLVPYILPMVVPVAVLASDLVAAGRGRRSLALESAFLALVALAAIAAGWHFEVGRALGRADRLLLAAAAALALAGALGGWRLARAGRLRGAALALALFQLAALTASTPAVSAAGDDLTRDGTGRDVALAIRARGPEAATVVCYKNLIRGLPFYLGHEVTVVRDPHRGERTWTTRHGRFEDVLAVLADGPTLVVARRRHVEHLRQVAPGLSLVWEGKKLALLSNRESDSATRPSPDSPMIRPMEPRPDQP